MSLNHEQWWDKWEFRLEWVGDVHRTRDLEERVHWVMDYVGIDLALRTLDSITMRERHHTSIGFTHQVV